MRVKVLFKLAWLHVLSFLINIARWLFSCVIIEILSILFSCPVIMIYLCVLNSINKTNQFFHGNLWLLWLTGSMVVFVPMLISVIVRIIQHNMKSKQEQKKGDTK